MPSERWLITGALGCIGAWCCRHLVREGHAVMAFDPQTDRRRWELVMSGDEIATINHVSGDITEIEAVERTLAENDTTHLVHLAAMLIPLAAADPPRGALVNVVGTVNVFEAAKRHGLPGHTLGHIGLWDPTSRVAITIDAALSDGIYDRAGNKLIPPRYYDADAYRSTIRRIRALEPELLLTAHYEPMDAVACRSFCERSLGHVDAVEAVVQEAVKTGEARLKELTDLVDQRLGPFPEFTTELAAGIRSHLAAVT